MKGRRREALQSYPNGNFHYNGNQNGKQKCHPVTSWSKCWKRSCQTYPSGTQVGENKPSCEVSFWIYLTVENFECKPTLGLIFIIYLLHLLKFCSHELSSNTSKAPPGHAGSLKGGSVHTICSFHLLLFTESNNNRAWLNARFFFFTVNACSQEKSQDLECAPKLCLGIK